MNNENKNKRKRQDIDLETKKQIIDASNKGQKNTEIAKKYDIDPSTISKILKQKDQILAAIEEGSSANRKRISKPSNLDNAVLSWLKIQRSNNVPKNV